MAVSPDRRKVGCPPERSGSGHHPPEVPGQQSAPGHHPGHEGGPDGVKFPPRLVRGPDHRHEDRRNVEMSRCVPQQRAPAQPLNMPSSAKATALTGWVRIAIQ